MDRRKFLSASAALLGSAGAGVWLSRRQGWWKGPTPVAPKRPQPIKPKVDVPGKDFTEHWEYVARKDDIETLREQIVSTYAETGDFKAIEATRLSRWLETRNVRPQTILDFGCGLGRNFSTWRRMANNVVGFDLPAMINRCRQEDPDVDLLTSDWSAVKNQHFSLIVAILVLQHMGLDELQEKLADMRRMTPLLFISGRWYTDDRELDVMQIVLKSGFRVLEADFSQDSDGTQVSSRKDNIHWKALFSSGVGDILQLNTKRQSTEERTE